MPRRSDLRRFRRPRARIPRCVLLRCSQAARKPAPTRATRVPVTVARAERSARCRTRSSPPAPSRPIQTAAVGSQVGGMVTRIAFREGDDVSAGQALIQLDPRPFRAALDQAAAALARDRAQAQTARLDAERAAKLFEQNLLSQSGLRRRPGHAPTLRGTVQSDSAAVAPRRLDLEYATIRAPIAGRDRAASGARGRLREGRDPRPARHDQPDPTRSGCASRSRSRDRAARPALPASGAPRVEPSPTADSIRRSRAGSCSSTTRWTRRPARSCSRASSRTATAGCGPGQFVDVRLVLYVQRRAPPSCPPAPSPQGQQGTYVYVMKPDSTRRARARSRWTALRRRSVDHRQRPDRRARRW